ncbi:MAG: DUF2442 domain-containing protein [Pseudomonadota bacterium]
MYYHVINAACLRDYNIFIEFEDGNKGVIDLADKVGRGGVFMPLADRQYFCKMKLDKQLHTITWENGADLSPEFLYERLLETRKTQ